MASLMFLGKKTKGSEGLGPSMGPEAYRTYLWYRTAEVGLELNEGLGLMTNNDQILYILRYLVKIHRSSQMEDVWYRTYLQDAD